MKLNSHGSKQFMEIWETEEEKQLSFEFTILTFEKQGSIEPNVRHIRKTDRYFAL